MNEEYKGVKFEVVIDEDNESPRDWDNLGTIVCAHRKYNIGDEQARNIENYFSWEKWFKGEIGNDVIALPVYLYDHSGQTISTTPFSCSWDSGQIGYIYVSKEKVRKEYNVKKISKKTKEKVLDILLSEIEIYDKYIKGEIYLYNINEGEEICGGFYSENDAVEAAKEQIDCKVA